MALEGGGTDGLSWVLGAGGTAEGRREEVAREGREDSERGRTAVHRWRGTAADVRLDRRAADGGRETH
jgi:hypothetical protein